MNAFGDIFYSFQLSKSGMYHFSVPGGVLLGLCLASLTLNRKKISARLAGAWIGFSVLLLLVIGWGSPENGMVLYSLYFSWAFFVLLFLLMDWIAEKGKMKLLVPAVSCVAAAALIVCNYHGMADLLAFATRYYPM